MNDMAILSQLIQDNARVPTHEQYAKCAVRLCEEQAQDSAVTIYGLPDDAMIINADKFTPPRNIFKNSKHECKRADYVIVSEEEKCMVYIEMKRGTDPWESIKQQLLGAHCFMMYCKEIGKAFWNKDAFLQEYRPCFVYIGHAAFPKRGTRDRSNTGNHDTPDKALRITGRRRIPFTQFLGS